MKRSISIEDRMQNISFSDLPEYYASLKNKIQNELLQKIYSEISFLYLSLINSSAMHTRNNIKQYLNNYLQNCNFLTYYYYEIKDEFDSRSNTSHQTVNVIICIENQCLIIEKIDFLLIKELFDKLEKLQKIAVNVSECTLNEEIANFMNYFKFKNKNNDFYNMTIRPISGFLIRRFFCPTNYFKDPSFFTIGQVNNKEEEELRREFNNIFSIEYLINRKMNFYELTKIVKKIRTVQESKKVEYHEFQEKEFIDLRVIYSKPGTIYNLVIHIESQHIFLMKKTSIPEESSEMSHEIYFCKNHSHRCLTKFYGFLKNKQKIVGFIYEYMCNGSLKNIYEKNQIQNDDFFKLLVINRVFQGIDYLHSNSLIHRDIKPSNILFDHDYLPYISDFETIRQTCDNQASQVEMTGDLGSTLYASPEQERGETLSYATDVYSFGLILYFLYENKNLVSTKYSKKEDDEIPKIANCSNDFQRLFQSCIQFNPDKRIKNHEIKKIIIDEINSFFEFGNHLNEGLFKYDNAKLVQMAIERILICIDDNEAIKQFYEIINDFQIVYKKYFVYISVPLNKKLSVKSQKKQIYSNALFDLGQLFYFGTGIKRNILKAKFYYELSAEMDNMHALFTLGQFYYNGEGVEQNYLKAKEYFEKSAKQNHSGSIYNLGNLYYYGYGVEKNYSKAKKYFKLASSLKNSYALLLLGDMYYKGEGVDQSYSKAKKYYQKSAKLNHSFAFLMLGHMYYKGDGVEKNFLEAMKYYNKSAELKNSFALCKLGDLYLKGEYVNKNYTKAIEYYEKSAEQKNSEALFKLGDLYMNGEGIEKDYLKAKHYYELSAEQNNPMALNRLSLLYFNGFGVEQNYLQSLKYSKQAARQNDPEALYVLGNFYYSGLIVKQDFLMAKKYYELSAKQNYSDAQLQLGFIYQKGDGVEQNYLKAREYYELAAKQNNSDAIVKIGILYYEGHGVEQSYSKAKEYFELAAKHNNSCALGNLGNMYLKGEGVDLNYSKAKEYLELAAKQNNSFAFINLGNMYSNGYGVKQSYLKAKEYYELSIKQGNSHAYLCLGFLYRNQKGIEQSYLKSKECYELAAKQNNPDALVNLRNIYLSGEGVEKDYSKAIEYFELAAKQNNSSAFYNLGNIYLYGKGVKQDYLKAKNYFELSAKLNNPNALLNLGCIYLNGFGVEQSYQKAKEYYELSAKMNNSCAMLNLGYLYFYGEGFPKDYPRAKYYFELAAKKNNSKAFLYLGYLYENGEIYQKNYSKAIEYYKLAADQNESFALLFLGKLYYNGKGVKKDFVKAKEYYELSSIMNNIEAHLNLGCYYLENGKSQYDYLKAKDYFELSAKENNPTALFNLGYLYFSGLYFDVDISKAMKYFLKCSRIHIQKINANSLFDINNCVYDEYNYYYYRVFNDLGLIYLVLFEDIEKATEYIKKSAFGEYPFGQNNFGLLNQFYLNELEKADHFYKRSSEHNFPLAEYNLGYLKEKENKINEAIDYYQKASEHEDEKLIFHDSFHGDHMLEVSKTFILCLTNLKLSLFYLKKSRNDDSKKYFIKAFSKLISLLSDCINNPFRFLLEKKKRVGKDIFSFLKIFIIFSPYFNLKNNHFSNIRNFISDNVKEVNLFEIKNQSDVEINKENQLKTQKQISEEETKYQKYEKLFKNDEHFNLYELNQIKKYDFITERYENEGEVDEINNQMIFNEIKEDEFIIQQKYNRNDFDENPSFFTNPGNLFDFVIKDDDLKKLLFEELEDIIQTMEAIIYLPPFPILFGRMIINIHKQAFPRKEKIHSNLNNINNLFYEGIGQDIL